MGRFLITSRENSTRSVNTDEEMDGKWNKISHDNYNASSNIELYEYFDISQGTLTKKAQDSFNQVNAENLLTK